MSKAAWIRLIATVSLVILLICGLTLLVFNRVEWLRRMNSFSEPFVMPPGSVLMRISPETSFITGPLKGDTLDFFAALEEHYTPEFRPEENGYREIVQLFGRGLLREIPYEQWTELCRKLSLDPADPPTFDYLRLIDHLSMKLAEAHGPGVTLSDAWDVYFRYGKPDKQTPEDMELLGSWLDLMAPAFVVIEKALEKPVYFAPPGRIDGRTDLRFISMVQRSLQEFFRLRVIYRLSINDATGAWSDVLTMYRLARLHSRQPFLNSVDNAVAFDVLASVMAQDVIRTGLLNDDQLRQALLDLDRLPMAAVFEDHLDTERLGLLQCVAELPEKGPAAFRIHLVEQPMAGSPKKFTDAVEEHNRQARDINQVFRALPFDWNVVSKTINAGYDELLGKKPKDESPHGIPLKTYRDLKPLSVEERSMEFGKYLFANYGPSRERWNLVCARRDVAFELTRSMIVLERYKNRNGDYPTSLAELVETGLLDRVPADAYRQGEPMIYRREGTGYLLYSIGPNGEDNHGKHAQVSPPDDPAWDDVSVKMP